MDTGISNQAYLFLIFTINGILIGIVFDIFRILRKSFNTPNYLTYIEDVLFWIISAIIVMYSVFIFNNGSFRGYIFIGIFLGIALYMLFFSNIIINISVKIISFIKKIFSYIFKILEYPIRLIYRLLILPIIHIFTKIFKTFVKISYNIKNNHKKGKILEK